MNDKSQLLSLYEDNRAQLAQALMSAHGNLEWLMDQPLVDVLRSLALNDVRLSALYVGSKED